MRKLKKLIGQIHLWLGLASGLVVFVVALTGCLYVFEEEARMFFYREHFYVKTVADKRHSLYETSKAVKVAFPEEDFTQIRFSSAVDATYRYHTKSKRAIGVNPYTLEIQSNIDLEKDFFAVILDLHRTLMLGEIGEQIIKWNVLIFLILCISGFILWIPKQLKFLKQAVTIKWKAKSWKRLNWDLHSVLGFYALIFLIIMSLTGIFWVFDSAKWMVSKLTGEAATDTKPPEVEEPAGRHIDFSMEDAYYKAKQLHGGEAETFIGYPSKDDQPIRVLFRYPYAIVRKQNTLFFDQNTGELLRQDLYKDYNAYDKVMRANYDFHTGRIRILGIGSKIVYFLASLFGASLPISGFLIWWGKRKPVKSKKYSKAVRVAVRPTDQLGDLRTVEGGSR